MDTGRGGGGVIIEYATPLIDEDEGGILPCSTCHQRVNNLGSFRRTNLNMISQSGMLVVSIRESRFDVRNLRQSSVLEIGEVLRKRSKFVLVARKKAREVVQLSIKVRIHVVDLVGNVFGIEQIKDGLRAYLLRRPMHMPDGRSGYQVQAIGFSLRRSRSKPTVRCRELRSHEVVVGNIRRRVIPHGADSNGVLA